MKILGMTGFGHSEGVLETVRWSWDVRSVNGKGLDVRLNMPSGLEKLDSDIRKLLKARLSRGSIQAQLRIDSSASSLDLQVDTRLLARLARGTRLMALAGAAKPSSGSSLLALRGVMSQRTDDAVRLTEEQEGLVLKSLDAALTMLLEARRREGESIAGMLAPILDDLDGKVAEAEGGAAQQPCIVRERFIQRLDSLMTGDEGLSEDRIAQEAAVMAAKADVREELDRLRAHLAAARDILEKPEPKGRQLDFLSQELNREANTLCSKSASLALTNTGLALKAGIEQFREQIQNVE